MVTLDYRVKVVILESKEVQAPKETEAEGGTRADRVSQEIPDPLDHRDTLALEADQEREPCLNAS